MMAMNDLNSLTLDQSRRTENETQLERTFGRRDVKGHAQLAYDLGKLAAIRPGHGDLMAETTQTEGEFCALVVGAAAGEQRIQLKESKRCRGVTHGPFPAGPMHAVGSRISLAHAASLRSPCGTRARASL